MLLLSCRIPLIQGNTNVKINNVERKQKTNGDFSDPLSGC